MINMALLISILVFIGIALLGSGIFSFMNYRRERHKLVNKIKRKGEGSLLGATVDTYSQNDSMLKRRFLNIVSYLGHRVKPKSNEELSRVRKNMLRAGLRRHNAPVIFFGVKTLFAILLPASFFFLNIFFMKHISSVQLMIASISFAMFGFYLPNLWLRAKTARRKEKIFEGFPDALDLMVVCVEAGMGLDAAINRVGEEMKLNSKVISDEFRLLSLELRAGKTRRDALRNLAMRMDLEDVTTLISLLIQTDKFGTRVAQALRVNSDSMRTKRYQRAEEMAAKLPVKLIFPLILFIFPSLFLTIMGPAAIQVYHVILNK